MRPRMKAIRVHEFGGPEVMQPRRRARSRKPAPDRGARARFARPASIRSTPTSAPARTRASRHCRTRRDRTARAKSRRSAPRSASFEAGRSRVHRGLRRPSAAAPGRTRSARSARRRSSIDCRSATSFGQGAALGVPYATAYRALFQRADARPGETVLVHGATGGVGIAAVELAHARGLRVIGSGGTDAAWRSCASTAPT